MYFLGLRPNMAFQLQGGWGWYVHDKNTQMVQLQQQILYIYRYTKHGGLIKPNFSLLYRVRGGQSKTGYNDSLIVRISNTIIVMFYPF